MKIEINQEKSNSEVVKVFVNAFEMGRSAALKSWEGR